jgi:hypothetical protein
MCGYLSQAFECTKHMSGNMVYLAKQLHGLEVEEWFPPTG